ncbi:hypothetical protein [Sulfitobacter sp. 1A12779]|uniref:hypothetical protein n=1 Tax=Sulfitobacter sp. 1A12779 TaxID=3368599 RepID=UPI003744C00F
MLRHLPLVSLIFILCSGLKVSASEVPWAVTDYIDRELLAWVNDARIVDAIAQQNARHREMNALAVTPAAVTGPVAEVAQPKAPIAAAFLQTQIARAEGQIAGVTLLDAYGLTVVSSGSASVYFKGGKPKNSIRFSPPSGIFVIDQVAVDERSKAHQSRVSMPITEPSNGAIIGVITVELEAAAFF